MEIVQFEYRGRVELGRMETAEGELLNVEVKNPESYMVGDFIGFFYGGRKFSVKIIKKDYSIFACLFRCSRRIFRITGEDGHASVST